MLGESCAGQISSNKPLDKLAHIYKRCCQDEQESVSRELTFFAAYKSLEGKQYKKKRDGRGKV